MADDFDNDLEEGKEGSKKGFLKTLIIPMLVSAVTASIVGVIFTFVLAPKPPEPKDEIDVAVENAATIPDHGVEPSAWGKQTGIYHNYDPFIVSIFDREKVHYLKVVMSLELHSEIVKEEIAAKNPQIRDAMIFVLSDFTLRELLDNQAKNLLKEILVKTLNKILGKGKVVNIYFTEFTIQ